MYPGTYADTTPDKAAVVVAETGAVLTYAELDERSTRLADVLRRHGLGAGDHIAFVADNVPEVFVVYWAALRSGLYVTGINNHLTAPEAAYIVEDCGATVLLASVGAAELAAGIDVPAVTLKLALDGAVPGFEDYEAALAAASPQRPDVQPAGADMLYSSGTTGRPKGVLPVLPTQRVDEPGDLFTAVFAPAYGFDADTVYYSAAPLYHAAPLRFAGIVHRVGGTVVLARKFEPEAALAAVERFGITHSQWVPTMFVRMLKLPDDVRNGFDVSSLRVAVHAAAPCPVEVKRQMMAWWGPILHEYYSSTEANGVTMIGPDDWATHPGTVGRAALGVLHICDDDDGGAELPVGEIGTVYFERPTAPFAYHNDPEKTAGTRHPEHDNWTAVGDIGRVDDEGYLYLTDRKAFMIISGGVNVYPQEAEDVLVLHPAVADVAVIGVPDDDLGESVLGVVQVVEGVEPSPDLAADLIGFGRERLAHVKVPRRIEFLDQLPRSATGKLVKRRLTERYR